MTTGANHVGGQDEVMRVADAWRGRFARVTDLRELVAGRRPVHASSRSELFHVERDGVELMVKRSLRQERDGWRQFTGAWRHGEGVRTFELLRDLQSAGLPVPPPVVAFDRRRGFLVVESWVAYERVDALPCRCEDAPAIARLLHEVHERGWIHGDPHVANFLRQGSRLWIVDCVSARPRRSRLARNYDVVLLDKCCPGSGSAYPALDARALSYRAARLCCRSLVAWRALKGDLRRLAGRLPG